MLGGWYDTGDIIHVDTEGYFWVRGRAKRFAKVSGEMVSLTAVEDALAGRVSATRRGVRGGSGDVAGHGERGETRRRDQRAGIDIGRGAPSRHCTAGMTNLCVPRDLRVMDELPKLGTGKLNHREVLKHVELGQAHLA